VQHCTPETLALAALREPLPSADAAHLDGCAACRDEVTSLQRSVDALAVPEFAASVAPVAPPPAVWAGIAAATGVDSAPRPELLGGTAPPPPIQAVADVPPAEPVEPRVEPGVVRELRPRRSRILLAMAASLLVGAGIGAGAVALANRDTAEEVAAADLAPLDDRDATGSAEVVATGDGEQLRVVLEAPELDDGFYEVWLLEPAVERMVQIGVVRAGTTTLDLPEGLDLAEYPIVDVSVEPLDGVPTHSGVSVARGVLES
jgi:Anti-sigma-K factor rskA